MNEESKPLVTLITLVYNNADYVVPALEYIKKQQYSPIEHIINDDCSTDDSAEKIQKWIDANNYQCKFIRRKKNLGICASMNELIRIAKGKYFYGVSDDWMEPQKLIKDVELLEANPSYAFCSSNMVIRNMKTGVEERRKYDDGVNLFYKLLTAAPATIATPTTIYKTQALRDVGYFDETLLFEDYDMFLRLLDRYPFGYRDDYSVTYCVHPKSIQQLQDVKFHNEFFNILKKWRHLPFYQYYVCIRHQYVFCYFAVKNKKEAWRHLLPAMLIFWRINLYKGLIRFLFYKRKYF